jgi:hypothetical protein
MKQREVLVKVEYHGQVWYIVQKVTMGSTHVETNRLRESYVNLRQTSRKEDVEGHPV